MMPEERMNYRNTLNNAWVNTTIKTEETNVELLPAGYWASLCYKNNRAVVFRHNLSKNRRFGSAMGHNSNVLHKQFSSIFDNIMAGNITGDVVLYRSSRTRWAEIKHPLHSEIKNTFFIMTGQTYWINKAYPVLRPEMVESAFNAEFIRFRAHMKYNRLNAQKFTSQRRQSIHEFDQRASAVFSMLKMPSETWDDEFIEHNQDAPCRTGFLMWRDGKVLVWWHKTVNSLSPQHLASPQIPRQYDSSNEMNIFWELTDELREELVELRASEGVLRYEYGDESPEDAIRRHNDAQ